MNFTWEQEPLENLSESVPDLELGPGLLTPIPVLCSLQTAPLALRAGLMTLSLVVEGKEKVTLGLWASIQGTFPAGPTEVSGTRGEGGRWYKSLLAGRACHSLRAQRRDTLSNTGHVLLFINPEEGCPRWPSSWLIGFHDNFLKGNFLRSSVVSCPRGPVRLPLCHTEL